MIKKHILTVGAAAFSLLIVYGGWFLSNQLMDRQQYSLMNTVNSIPVKDTTTTDQDMENEPERLLSSNEIVDILKVWNFDMTGYYHDPIDGQLTMEEAIKAAKSGLSYFCNKGVLPEEIINNEYAQTNAFLYDIQGKTKTTNPGVLSSMRPSYSFWSVSLANQKVLIQLTLNAQTGQIWMADISSSYYGKMIADINVLDLLLKYETYLGLTGGDSLRRNDYYATKNYANNQFGIITYKKSEAYSNYGMVQFSLGSARQQ